MLEQSHLAQLLGMSIRTMQKRRMNKRNWPFSELPKLDRKPRWSRDVVLAVINGGAMAKRAGR